MPISASVADSIYKWASILLVTGAALTLISTLGAVWSGAIRERFTTERIAMNEAETSRANEETAKAKLETERLKSQMAWRRVNIEQAKVLKEDLKGHHLEPWLTYLDKDPESTTFREDINDALAAAGIKTKFFSGYERAVGLTVKGGTEEQRALLLKTFHRAGLPLFESAERSRHNGELEILVGSKPPPQF